MTRDHLRGLIEQVSAATESERRTKALFIDLIESVEQPWRRSHFDPGHLTASAFVVDLSNRFVAMVDHPVLARPLQPGGHIEPTDESVERAAIREVREELGITAIGSQGVFDLDVHTFPKRQSDPEHLHFDIRFHFTSPRAELRPAPGEAPARWISISDALVMDPSIARPAAKLTVRSRW